MVPHFYFYDIIHKKKSGRIILLFFPGKGFLITGFLSPGEAEILKLYYIN
jgi:hypothetical protein